MSQRKRISAVGTRLVTLRDRLISDATQYYNQLVYRKGFDGVTVGATMSTTGFDAEIREIENHNNGRGGPGIVGVITEGTQEHKYWISSWITKGAIMGMLGNRVYGRLVFKCGIYQMFWYTTASKGEVPFRFPEVTQVSLDYVLFSARLR